MSQNQQTLKDDVAFLRALAETGAAGAAREGAILLASGAVFSLVAVQTWAIDAGLLHPPRAVGGWLWLDGFIPFLLAWALISAKFRNRPPGAASRALTATWAGVGPALVVVAVGLEVGSRGLGLPFLAKWVFPLVLFTLIGGAWGVAFAVRRRKLFGLVAAGSFAAVILCGALMGRPEEWLALSAGLLLLVAVPGGVILAAALGRR